MEALVQGSGWEDLPPEYAGTEPQVAAVLTITGQYEQGMFYWLWKQILGKKDSRNNLTQVLVEGAGHNWNTVEYRIPEEVDKWLKDVGA